MRQLLVQLRLRPRTIGRYIRPHCITRWRPARVGCALVAGGWRVAFDLGSVGKRAASDYTRGTRGSGILLNFGGCGIALEDIMPPGQRATIRVATPSIGRGQR